VGGLKKVMRLEVSADEDTVTSFANRERPGNAKGPRLTQEPSVAAMQSALDWHAFRSRQAAPCTR
jgi:hypothetical protein